MNTGIRLNVTNSGAREAEVIIRNVYTAEKVIVAVAPGAGFSRYFGLKALFGWYDLTVQVAGGGTFLQHFAGHLETGVDSISDPAIGGLGLAP